MYECQDDASEVAFTIENKDWSCKELSEVSGKAIRVQYRKSNGGQKFVKKLMIRVFLNLFH